MHIYQIEGLVRDVVNCASVEDPCPDGSPPFTVPGQCCPTCGMADSGDVKIIILHNNLHRRRTKGA